MHLIAYFCVPVRFVGACLTSSFKPFNSTIDENLRFWNSPIFIKVLFWSSVLTWLGIGLTVFFFYLRWLQLLLDLDSEDLQILALIQEDIQVLKSLLLSVINNNDNPLKSPKWALSFQQWFWAHNQWRHDIMRQGILAHESWLNATRRLMIPCHKKNGLTTTCFKKYRLTTPSHKYVYTTPFQKK